MTIRVAINGFGRIGRCLMRLAHKDKDIDFVAINDITDVETLAHLLKYDSVHGTFETEVAVGKDSITVSGDEFRVYSERDPANLPWAELGVDVVVEATGLFRDRDSAKKHLDGGAGRVLITAPGRDPDVTFVYGVNHEDFDPKSHFIISSASCTTNCLAPTALVLQKEFGIKSGFMTTIHSYTNDQRLLDLPHKDLRRARAAAVSMVPTTTGAAKALGLVIPELKGKLDGMAVRVPTPNVSAVDLVVQLERETSTEEVNQKYKEYTQGALADVLLYTEEPLVSCDYIGCPVAGVIDGKLTNVVGGNLAKVFAWYDNEWGFTVQLLSLLKVVGGK